ncbi:MAG: RNA-binding S4 domain-containing protein [Ruminococcaceae bacterium]|nr:RNA-binding S4 domain-containing protein [Oscillospiraceae bacterium]
MKKFKNIRVKVKEKEVKKIEISTDFIRLDSALKLCDIAPTGGIAKIIIGSGDIKVNNEVCIQRGKKLRSGDCFEFEGTVYEII